MPKGQPVKRRDQTLLFGMIQNSFANKFKQKLLKMLVFKNLQKKYTLYEGEHFWESVTEISAQSNYFRAHERFFYE